MATLQAVGSQSKHAIGHVVLPFHNRQVNDIDERWKIKVGQFIYFYSYFEKKKRKTYQHFFLVLHNSDATISKMLQRPDVML